LLEQGVRQKAKGDAVQIVVARRTQVWSGPDEAVGFRKNDPGSFVIETKAAFGGGRYLNRVVIDKVACK
jgi:hypothetical protein